MQIDALDIAGAWLVQPKVHADDRGAFLEWFRADHLAAAVGTPFSVAQANHSISGRGVVRGVHFADVPPGQAKYVYCPSGAVLDVVVDLRVGSPTFGRHEAVRLDEENRRAVFIAEGLGHAFCALTDDTAVTYLVSSVFDPAVEHGVSPLDPELALPWPADVPLRLSPKDEAAPSLAEAARTGLLPRYLG